MGKESENRYAEWVYNRYVEASRQRDYTKMSVYFEVLHRYNWMIVEDKKFSNQKKRTAELLRMITSANRKGTVQNLQLVGREFTMEFERMMAEYEKELRSEGLNENTIKTLVLIKKEKYGND